MLRVREYQIYFKNRVKIVTIPRHQTKS